MRSVQRARLALLALAVAGLAAVATGEPLASEVTTFHQGYVKLTPDAPVAVEHVVLRILSKETPPRAVTHAEGVVEIHAGPAYEQDPVDVSVVRSSDGAVMQLAPSDRIIFSKGLGGQFLAFASCGATSVCEERFDVTFRLRGSSGASADWYVYLTATYAEPVHDDRGLSVTVAP